jgi:hypothetical protein
MAILFEGDCKGKAVDVEIGPDKNGKARVRWNMLVTEGPHAGKKASYSGKLDAEHIKYTKRDMMAIGWKGKDAVGTFVSDVKAADLTVPFTAEIASNTYEDTGKTSQWTSARSIGFTTAPLGTFDKDKAKDVNSWFDEVPVEKPGSDIPF